MDTHILFDLNELPVEEEDAIEEQSKAKKTICEEPFVGQCFLSEEEALVFYQNYARKNGFSVRKGRFVNKKGERKRRDFFCHREGKSEPKKDNTKKTRTRGYVRCECKAHMRITLRRINEAARLHKVVWDGKMAECTCKNFEFVGILCRHILSVFLHTGCFEIPCCYWLSRWSREEAQFNKVSHLHQEGTLDATSSFADYSDPITNAIELVQCPIISKTKGRPKQKRMKSGKELAKQVKRCRICKSSSHNFSTCPERHASNDANNAQHVAKKSKLDMQSEVDCNPIFHFKC